MEYAYRVEAWQALYTALAGATAALTGLLFIALSLNLRTIVKVPAHKARARETFGGLLSLLIIAIFMLIPGQGRILIGIELIVGSVILTLVSARLNFQTIRNMPGGRLRWGLRITLLHSGTLTIVIAGISMIVEQFEGLFWLVPTIVIYLLWSLNNAWLLMVQVSEEG